MTPCREERDTSDSDWNAQSVQLNKLARDANHVLHSTPSQKASKIVADKSVEILQNITGQGISAVISGVHIPILQSQSFSLHVAGPSNPRRPQPNMTEIPPPLSPSYLDIPLR